MGSPDPLNLNRERRAAAKSKMGGKREGAGRPTGTTKKRSREIADGILSGNRKVANRVYEKLPDEATPLDVMIMAMREAYEVGGSLMAFPYAEKAAPYLHARISSVTLPSPTSSALVLRVWGGVGGGGVFFLAKRTPTPNPSPRPPHAARGVGPRPGEGNTESWGAPLPATAER